MDKVPGGGRSLLSRPRVVEMESTHNMHVRRWVAVAAIALLVLAVIGLYAWSSGRQLADLAALGYPGVFLIMLIAGASTLFPAPAQATILAAGALWNPLLVGVAAGLGNATGELVGYGAGRAGRHLLKGRKPPPFWRSAQGWLRRYGFFAVLVLAMIPNPVFDFVGLLAGSLGHPAIRRFWLACALGFSVKYAGLAYLGEIAVGWLRHTPLF